MRCFARLFEELDASTATSDKLAALRRHFAAAPAQDAAWAAWLLAGGKLRQVLPTALLRAAAARAAGLPDWLFEASYQAVGDLAETIALVLPPELPAHLTRGARAADATGSDAGLTHWIEQRLQPLRGLPPEQQELALLQAWAELDGSGRFLLVKLMGGGFRVGVSRQLVQRAIAEHSGLDARLVAQRMVGWTDARRPPSAAAWAALTAPPIPAGDTDAGPEGSHRCAVTLQGGTPFPFFLAHPFAGDPADSLGTPADWQIEWKYDGIRAQLVRRTDEQGLAQAWLWSRGEELIGESFPDVVGPALALPRGTVLDGELLVWPAGADRPAPFQTLQQRLQRKTLPRRLLESAPAVFLAYDLLEAEGCDLRQHPLQARRQRLEALQAAHPALRIAPLLQPVDWPACAALREQARSCGVEGLMLKQRDSRYGSGRTKADGLWWKWKLDPYRIDAVLVYAQAGHGRRAGVYTDYTFAVWSRPPADAAEAQAVVDAITRREPPRPGGLQLLTFAKAYSGLSDAEFQRVDRVIRASTLEKFGPVRSLRPTLVFELGFEGIGPSPRHKSGVAVRFPRLLRIRDDKPLHEADSLGTLHSLIVGT